MTQRPATEAEAIATVAQIQNVCDFDTAPMTTLRMIVETLGTLLVSFERRGWSEAVEVAEAAYTVVSEVAADRVLAV